MKKQKEVVIQQSSNRFKILISRVINIEISNRGEMKKDRKIILKEEKLKKGEKEKKLGSSLTGTKSKRIEV